MGGGIGVEQNGKQFFAPFISFPFNSRPSPFGLLLNQQHKHVLSHFFSFLSKLNRLS